MTVWALGCRGSTPAPGPATVRYGGHTSCLAVAAVDGPPSPLLDEGTGLANLAGLLDGRPFRGGVAAVTPALGPHARTAFAPSTDHLDAEVALYLPAQDVPAEELLAHAMSPPHFPIGPQGLRGTWTFDALEEVSFEVAGFEVVARDIPHKGGCTFCYRVTSPDGMTLAYLPDHQPSRRGAGASGFGPLHEAAPALAGGVDLLVHDAQYTAEEFPRMHSFGHSAIDYAAELARGAEAGQLLAFHHAPTRADTELDDLAERFTGEAIFAQEGLTLTL